MVVFHQASDIVMFRFLKFGQYVFCAFGFYVILYYILFSPIKVYSYKNFNADPVKYSIQFKSYSYINMSNKYHVMRSLNYVIIKLFYPVMRLDRSLQPRRWSELKP